MKLCIVGGSGFIGSAIVKELLADFNNEILTLSRSSIEPAKANHIHLKWDWTNNSLPATLVNFKPQILINASGDSHS